MTSHSEQTDAQQTRRGPLAGLRVIEIGRYIAAPYAAKLLADMGADVVKIESPAGDPMRGWEGAQGKSPQFAAYNRNKSSVVLDLKSDDGVMTLRSLIKGADIVIENFRPGVAERMGFGPALLREGNPRLITCSITGFGAAGPMSRRPSYDSVVSALGGMYSQILPQDAANIRPIGPAFSDLLAGMSAVQGVLAALRARDVDGHGQHVSISMLGSMVDFLTEPASTYLQTGAVSHPGTRPRRAQAYAATGSDDGSFIIHMSVPEKFWLGLVGVLDRADLLTDPRFATREARVENYDELDQEIKAEALTRPRAEWLQMLVEHDIPCGPLNTVEDLFADEQIRSMDLVVDLAGEAGDQVLKVPRHSVGFSHSGRPGYRGAPDLGADSERLLENQDRPRDRPSSVAPSGVEGGPDA